MVSWRVTGEPSMSRRMGSAVRLGLLVGAVRRREGLEVPESVRRPERPEAAEDFTESAVLSRSTVAAMLSVQVAAMLSHAAGAEGAVGKV